MYVKYIVQYYLLMSPCAIFDCFQTQFLSDRSIY